LHRYLGVNKYYDLATSFYEYGWGESFHFAHRYKWVGWGLVALFTALFLQSCLCVSSVQSANVSKGCMTRRVRGTPTGAIAPSLDSSCTNRTAPQNTVQLMATIRSAYACNPV
jgi:hypothetical protein